MSELILSRIIQVVCILLATMFAVSCDGTNPGEIFEPARVSVSDLRLSLHQIPHTLLEVRGFYSRQSISGVPQLYADEPNARMLNDAESISLSFVGKSKLSNEECADSYAKVFGYFDFSSKDLRVFVIVPYDSLWNETSPCWLTDVDWQNDPEYSHLVIAK